MTVPGAVLSGGAVPGPAARAPEGAVPQWVRLGEVGSRWGIAFMLWAYALFGRRFAALFLYPVVAYFFLRRPRERRASRDYLRRLRAVCPEALPFAGEPSARHVYAHFLEFAQTILDRLDILSGETRDYVFTRRGHDLLDRFAQKKQGAILMGAHLGSVDSMRIIAEKKGIFINALMFRVNARNISAEMNRRYSHGNLRILENDPNSVQVIFDLLQCMQRGELLAIHGDRFGPGEGGDRVSWVPFLGKPAAFPHGAWILASLLECPVLLTFGLRTGHRNYELYAEEFAERIVLPRRGRAGHIEAYIRRYAERLEYYIRKAPYQWFNFYDFWSGRE